MSRPLLRQFPDAAECPFFVEIFSSCLCVFYSLWAHSFLLFLSGSVHFNLKIVWFRVLLAKTFSRHIHVDWAFRVLSRISPHSPSHSHHRRGFPPPQNLLKCSWSPSGDFVATGSADDQRRQMGNGWPQASPVLGTLVSLCKTFYIVPFIITIKYATKGRPLFPSSPTIWGNRTEQYTQCISSRTIPWSWTRDVMAKSRSIGHPYRHEPNQAFFLMVSSPPSPEGAGAPDPFGFCLCLKTNSGKCLVSLFDLFSGPPDPPLEYPSLVWGSVGPPLPLGLKKKPDPNVPRVARPLVSLFIIQPSPRVRMVGDPPARVTFFHPWSQSHARIRLRFPRR